MIGTELMLPPTQLHDGTEIKRNNLKTLRTYGDVDYNGIVDMKDISLIARNLAVFDFNPCCDINEDGKIDLNDIAIPARNFRRGIFEIEFPGDPSWLYAYCQMFRHFSVKKLEWSYILAIYQPVSIEINLDVKDLSFEKLDDWSYHLDFKGLDECSYIVVTNYINYSLSVQARRGELDFTFPNCDAYYCRTAEIRGTLKGDVSFHIDVPDIIDFHYEGKELIISVQLGS